MVNMNDILTALKVMNTGRPEGTKITFRLYSDCSGLFEDHEGEELYGFKNKEELSFLLDFICKPISAKRSF